MNWKRIFRHVNTMSQNILILIGTFYAVGILMPFIKIYVTNKDTLSGAYNPITDTYACKTQFACIHEEGHSVDAHGAIWTGFWWDWRSTDETFRADIDTIFSCIQAFYSNNGDPKQRNLSNEKAFVGIHFAMTSDDEANRYLEAYAEVYEVMKLYHWDIYHYNDVEDMIAQKADLCRSIQAEILAANSND